MPIVMLMGLTVLALTVLPGQGLVGEWTWSDLSRVEGAESAQVEWLQSRD